MDPAWILSSSAMQLARAIRTREVTSREVVAAHVARIRAVNPAINAVVADRFEDALREADDADAAVGRGADVPALHGVPITIKESIACKGMPHTSGLWSRRNVRAEKDGSAVARLRAAGGIVLGVTNVSELCMWMESANAVWGRTNNPYDIARTAGGSSGGEGAIVGAGGSPLGLGADVGGSIRMPAFFNGVFGHKPTGGLVPNTGHYPHPENQLERYVTTGPIVRRAEDLMPALRIIAGPDGIERSNITLTLGDPVRDLRGIDVFVVRGNGVFAVSEEMLTAQARAADALQARGARISARELPALRRSGQIWSAMVHEAGGKTFREMLADGEQLAPLRELAKLPLGRSKFTLPALLLCYLERIPGLMPGTNKQMLEAGRALRAELEGLLGNRGVLMYPSYPTVAPRHHRALLPPLKWIYTAVFNVLEMPATQVPLGLDGDGLPLGIQVVGAGGSDALTIGVALELERAFGGWNPPARWPLKG